MEIKKHNPKMSKAALDIKGRISFKEWASLTINEHQEPLQKTWSWILEHAASLTPTDVLERFKRWPMVTVTKEEDERLRQLTQLDPGQRYDVAQIEVVQTDGRQV
jgi:hypothetical protein